VLASAYALTAAAQNPNPQWDDRWATLEAPFLTDHRQITSREAFVKAGESYFSPDGEMIIFQAIDTPSDGSNPERHYAMYVAPVVADPSGSLVRLGDTLKLSRPASANTCGWFHPTQYESGASYTLLYGTTTTSPDDSAASGYQRGTSRYTWNFPNEMEIVSGTVVVADLRLKTETESVDLQTHQRVRTSASRPWMKLIAKGFEPLWVRDGYDAEASWSPDGRHILYTRLEPGSDDGDLWIYDTERGTHTELIAEPGYDGGPFFSPDGRSICYRSDRRGDKLLQVFVARLGFDDDGSVVGIEREVQITDNGHVNWAPFFTPDGRYLFYASSEVSHANYEVFCVSAQGDAPPSERPTLRITHARGFDGLPAFSPDGKTMIWTAQRGALAGGESRPSSQLWAARIDLDAVDRAYREARRAMEQERLDDEFGDYTPQGVGP